MLYELCAEIVYEPNGSSEGLSAGLIVFIWNVAALVVLAVAPSCKADILNLSIVLIFALAAACVVLLTRESYGRSLAEAAGDEGGMRCSLTPAASVRTTWPLAGSPNTVSATGTAPLAAPFLCTTGTATSTAAHRHSPLPGAGGRHTDRVRETI